MRVIIAKKVYDTKEGTLIKKNAVGLFGDPKGYEESLYQNAEGFYFLYVNGGAESKYSSEKITRMSAAQAEKWQAEHNS